MVVLEFGGFAELVKKVNNGQPVADIEKKTIKNYLYQERRINGGFVGQGQALYESDEPQQSYEWSQSGLEFLQQVKEKKYIPEKALMEKKFKLY